MESTEKEVRAYVHQKLAEFEGILPEGTSLNVVLQQEGKKHVAKIEAKTMFGPISSVKEDQNIYTAISLAAQVMHGQLEAIHKAVLSQVNFEKPTYLH